MKIQKENTLSDMKQSRRKRNNEKMKNREHSEYVCP